MPEAPVAGAARIGYLRAMRLWVPAILALLAFAPAAHADVTIGSTLPPVNAPALSCPVNGCTLSPTAALGQQPVTAPSAGVVTRWRVRVGPFTTLMALQVLRRNGTGAAEVGRSAIESPLADDVREFVTRLPIAAGDSIALWCCHDNADGAHVLAQTMGTSLDIWDPTLGDVARPPDFARTD